MEDEEYEIVPLSPIRKLEKRMSEIEKGTPKALGNEVVDIIKTNQGIVDDLVRVNSDTAAKVSELTVSVNRLVDKLDDFIKRIEISGENVATEKLDEIEKNTEDRLAKLEKRMNALLLSKMSMPARTPRRPPMRSAPRPPI